MTHQFNLFGFQPPKKKIPISAERIKEVQAAIAKGDGKTAAARMRDLREHLENIERNIHNGTHYENPL